MQYQFREISADELGELASSQLRQLSLRAVVVPAQDGYRPHYALIDSSGGEDYAVGPPGPESSRALLRQISSRVEDLKRK